MGKSLGPVAPPQIAQARPNDGGEGFAKWRQSQGLPVPDKRSIEELVRDEQTETLADALVAEFGDRVRAGELSLEDVKAIGRERAAAHGQPAPVDEARLDALNSEIETAQFLSRSRPNDLQLRAKLRALRDERDTIVDAAMKGGYRLEFTRPGQDVTLIFK